ncbi:MAG TPA: hypothetical protein VHP82_04215 [Gaiellaceae bacterium]|jgi:hypothetical protein|nr:hypothetical protein [Gaiellaceae bacterium]
MALLVVLVSANGGDMPLGPETAEALARLGVTSVALARDDRTTAVVLEGWAFGPRHYEAAVAALGADADARTLRPVVHMAVSSASNQEGALT